MSTDINIKKRITILEESAILTKDVNSIDFVGTGVVSSAIGDDVTVTINSSGGSVGAIGYYLNQSVTQSPYKEFSSIITTAVEQVVPLTVAGGVTSVIAEFQTPTGVPGTTQIVAGLWAFYLHFNAGSAGQNWIIRPTVWKRDLGGTETLLFTSDPVIVTNMNTTTEMYTSDGVFPATTLVTTDRLVVRISMQNTTGVSQTVNFRTEGSQHYSVSATTLNQSIPSGAVTSVTGTTPVVSSGGTTPAISIPQATGAVDGYLSSSDFAVFNAKVGGSGTTNYLSKFTGTGTIGNSQTQDNGANIAVNGAIVSAYKFAVYSTTAGENYNIYGNTTVNGAVGVAGVNQGVGASTNYGTSGTAQSSTALNIGVYGQATGASAENVGGKFSAILATANYSVQLQDGTEGIGKVLTSMTADGKAQWAALSTNIPQANKIYVDSINGVNSTGRGNINNPYLTVEYALADITNTGTVTATTTNLSATLTAVSSTANIVIGQFITGTGIPYGSTVISKTSNTIVLSKTCTASATITATWYTIYEINTNGSVTWVSNWEKEGFIFNLGTSVVTFSGIVFNITVERKTPRQILGGYWRGNNSISRLMSSDYVSSSCDIFINILDYYSIGVNTQIRLASAVSYQRLTVNCPVFDARFGIVASINGNNCNWNGYKYGLLGGITYAGIFASCGGLETPSSIDAIINSTNSEGYINEYIKGQINNSSAAGFVLNGNVIGTTMTFTTGQYYKETVVNGNINATTINTTGASGGGYNGSIIFNGGTYGAVVNTKTNGLLTITSLSGTYNGSSTSKAVICNANTASNLFTGITSITLSGTAQCNVIDNTIYYGTPGSSNYVCGLNIGSGTLLKINNNLQCIFTATMAGTIELNSASTMNLYSSQYYNMYVTGTINNNFGTIILSRVDGAEVNFVSSPCIKLSTGTYNQRGGKLYCTNADSKSGLIAKTGSGSKVQLSSQAYLRVSNGLAPLQILSNTGTAQDVFNFGIIGNGGVGFRIANTFSDTTYGTAYAPNILGGGTNYEDTTYSF